MGSLYHSSKTQLIKKIQIAFDNSCHFIFPPIVHKNSHLLISLRILGITRVLIRFLIVAISVDMKWHFQCSFNFHFYDYWWFGASCNMLGHLLWIAYLSLVCNFYWIFYNFYLFFRSSWYVSAINPLSVIDIANISPSL